MNELARISYQLFNLRLNPAQVAAFEAYEKELLSWNARFNLTAIQEPSQIMFKHFLDSLSCLLVMRESTLESVVDVGSGAGFPGLPLKIACPQIHLTLVESVGKKVAFLNHIISLLGLQNVTVVNERAETIGHQPEHRQKYDWAVARAVAIMPVLAEYLLPLVKIGGGMLAMKGENAPAETQAADQAFRILGGHLHRLVPVTLPGVSEERYLVIIGKIAATPENYPRRVGVPVKKPL
jgi:16S rRNA (guanine527-N7)-methyltransferase